MESNEKIKAEVARLNWQEERIDKEPCILYHYGEAKDIKHYGSWRCTKCKEWHWDRTENPSCRKCHKKAVDVGEPWGWRCKRILGARDTSGPEICHSYNKSADWQCTNCKEYKQWNQCREWIPVVKQEIKDLGIKVPGFLT